MNKKAKAIGGQPAPAPSPETTLARKSKITVRTEELLSDRIGQVPVWIRAPKNGSEFYSGFSRAKLYQLTEAGHIRSVSIREPGKLRGTRLFNLQSILDFVARCEQGEEVAA